MLHKQLEAILYSHEPSKNGLSYHSYFNLLRVYAAFHQNLAAQLANRSDFPIWLIERQQQRANWLKDDASELSCQLADVVLLYETKYQLLGALYLAEGSMLGARVLEKEFRSSECLTDSLAASTNVVPNYQPAHGAIFWPTSPKTRLIKSKL